MHRTRKPQSKHRPVRLAESAALAATPISEAATLKSLVKRLMRDVQDVLADKTIPESLRKQVQDVRDELKKNWSDLEQVAAVMNPQESQPMTLKRTRITSLAELTKKVNGVAHERGDFLVAEDANDISTWRLPVKVNGQPDPKLMGAAKAALTVGYRGNKYEGPGKAEALKKLKALYESEDMTWSEAEQPAPGAFIEAYFAEMYGSPTTYSYVPWGVRSFADLRAAADAEEAAQTITTLASQFTRLVENVIGDTTLAQKLPSLNTIVGEFMTLVAEALGEVLDSTSAQESFAESEVGYALALVESDPAPAAPPSPRDPLLMDVVLIQPGWGNKRDNNYYPAEVLQRDAKVFEGAKMYVTDHKENEKSVRTEVSQIERIIGFTETGAPIARVIAFEPNFAEMARNRAKAGVLDSLECSILANGRARKGTIDGQAANIVEAITSRQSVDWVTKAGAGGHAHSLAENGDIQMDPTKDNKVAEAAPAQATAATGTGAGTGNAQTVQISETQPATAPAAPIALAEADVKAAIEKLPAPVQKRLAGRQYADAAALKEAIESEIAYLKEVTSSGKPFQVEAAPASDAPARPLAEVNKTKDAINKKFLG